jgi:hypothetical protein
MKLLSVAGLVLFMLTSLIVSSRLWMLWWRTRKLPELLLAVALLCIGFLAYAAGTAGKLLVDGSEQLRSNLTVLGLGIECIGHMSLVLFSWRVFHRESRWAAVWALALCLFIAGALVGEVVSGQHLRYSDMQPISGPFLPLALAARATAPAWMAIECFRFHAKLRRRLAIGLAEPLVVQRVLLWGIGIGASAIAYAGTVLHRLVYGTGLRAHDWALSSVSLLATVTAVCLGLAFFPPAPYRRWVERRAAGGDGS